MNEIMALPYDAGESGLARHHIKDACNPDQKMLTPAEIKTQFANKGLPIFAGIDYGSGEGSPPSFTVLYIGCLDNTKKLRILYAKKFQGADADLASQPARVNAICREAGVRGLGADWGFGADKNARLCAEMGWKRQEGWPKLLEMRYTSQTLFATWKDVRFHLDRNQTMEKTFAAVKNYDKPWGIILPNYEEFRAFEADLTAPVAERNENHDTYKYVHRVPDDGFHALNYLHMAALHAYNILLPSDGFPRLA